MEINKVKKDSIVTFIRNNKPEEAHFNGEEVILSIPYSKILDTAQFCERENLDVVYLGFKNQVWQLAITKVDFKYYIVIDKNGVSLETAKEYVHSVNPDPYV